MCLISLCVGVDHYHTHPSLSGGRWIFSISIRVAFDYYIYNVFPPCRRVALISCKARHQMIFWTLRELKGMTERASTEHVAFRWVLDVLDLDPNHHLPLGPLLILHIRLLPLHHSFPGPNPKPLHTKPNTKHKTLHPKPKHETRKPEPGTLHPNAYIIPKRCDHL